MDVYGNLLTEQVDILLQNQTLSDRRRVQVDVSGKQLRLNNLHADTDNTYQLQVFPHSFFPVGRFVAVSSGTTREFTLTFPVDPRKVISVNFPPFDNLAPETQAVLTRSNAVLGIE